MSEGLSRVPAMVVFSNQRIGPAMELMVSPEVASAILQATADAARPVAQGRWEHELVRWLDEHALHAAGLDVCEIAWTPEHFEGQRSFLVEAIRKAAIASNHARALGLWAQLVDVHPRESVVVGRRWLWASNHVSI